MRRIGLFGLVSVACLATVAFGQTSEPTDHIDRSEFYEVVDLVHPGGAINVFGMNDLGTIVGYYQLTDGSIRPFALDRVPTVALDQLNIEVRRISDLQQRLREILAGRSLFDAPLIQDLTAAIEQPIDLEALIGPNQAPLIFRDLDQYRELTLAPPVGQTPVAASSGPKNAQRRFGEGDAPDMAAFAVNARGDTVGYSVDPEVGVRAFFRSSAGDLRVFDHPKAAGTTIAAGVNATGVISGFYTAQDQITRGYIFDPRMAEFTDIEVDVPNKGTYLQSINQGGIVVGHYTDLNDKQVSFLRHPDGKFEYFDYALASGPMCGQALNDVGDSGGWYATADGAMHGFVRYADGTFVTVDHSKGAAGTVVTGINDAGQIVGGYIDEAGVGHAFTAIPRAGAPRG